MVSYSGQTALITGASSGIGEAFVHALARRGAGVVLVARSEVKLRTLAAEVSSVYGVAAQVVVADLARENAAAKVVEELQERGLTIDLLVNNAGFGTYGYFEGLEPAREHEEVMLNVVAVADLTRALLPAMTARGRGALINVASTAAFQPVPYMATYGATKAFVLSFSEALSVETRRSGVRVLAVCAGATATNFTAVVGTTEVAVGSLASAERVVEEALTALERGRTIVVTGGLQNRMLALLPRLLPRPITVGIVERLFRPRAGAKPPRSSVQKPPVPTKR